MRQSGPDRLIEAYSQVASTNRKKFEKLQVVLTHFGRQGIDCILLKGADLILRLYGVLGLRAMSDVDLLVHEHDLPAIHRILTGLGCRPQIDGNPAYVDPEGLLALDLITGIWYVDNQEETWQRTVRRELDGIPVKGLGSNDLLIYLAAYSVVHRGYLSATVAQDITFLLEKEKVDWDFIVEEAQRRHLQIPLYHGFSYLSRVARVPIPDHIRRRLAPSRPTEKLLYLLFQKLVTDKPVAELGHLLLFLTQPGLKKWRWLRDTFSPSPAFLTYRYGDRGNTHPLMTRLCRPFSLLFQAIRLFIRIAQLQITRRV